jgi:hypothetical protein
MAAGTLQPAVIDNGNGVRRTIRGLSTGLLSAVNTAPDVDAPSSDEMRAEEADAPADRTQVEQFSVTNGTLGCRTRNSAGINVRVNQDCTFRRQAEEMIKINPSDANNIIAGQNDSRVGYNKCGFDFSFDGGTTWGDGLPPFYQRENHPELDGSTSANPNRNTILGGKGTAHTYDAGSDPAETFDSAGRAFFSCVMFDVNSNASGLLVTQSPAGAGGSFYDNVSPTGRAFVVVEDNSPDIVHDKEFISADTFPGSPNRDTVYVTWTVFRFGARCLGGSPAAPAFCSSAIFGSMSTDHGVTWSTPEEISGSSASLCFGGNFFDPTRSQHDCDFDQGSDSRPMADGSLVVAFFNQNTAPTNANDQELDVICHPSGNSASGTAHLHCGSPNLIGEDAITGEPQCNFGRGPEECVPGPWIRTNDYPRIALDKGNGDLYVVWQDYRHAEYDIQIRQSTDGGKFWTQFGPVNPTGADFYEAAIDVASNHHVAVSFYRSDRIPNENNPPVHAPDVCGTPVPAQCFQPGDPGVQSPTNRSVYILAGGDGSRAPGAQLKNVQISPAFSPPDGNQAGFNGDYSSIAVTGTTAHPVWSDTRNSVVQTSPDQGVVHDEDVFTDAIPVP